MARTITITDSVASIQFVNTDSCPTSLTTTSDIMKTDIRNIHYLPEPELVVINLFGGDFIKLDWNLVTVPTVVSAADLYYQLMVFLVNVPSNVFKQVGTFDNGDLVDGITTWTYTFTHPFNTTNVIVTVQDNLGNIVSTGVLVDVDATTITLGDFGGAIAGTYSYTLIAMP